MLHRFWDTARYWSKIADLNLPHQITAVGVIWLEFRQYFWHRKTRAPGLSYGVINVILDLAIFYNSDLSQTETDRQTNRRTDRHTMTANTMLA